MKILQDSKTTFRVTGDKDLVYVVDLSQNSKRGSCTCKHFNVRIAPKWRRGEAAEPCKHILFAYGHLMWNKLNRSLDVQGSSNIPF